MFEVNQIEMFGDPIDLLKSKPNIVTVYFTVMEFTG